MSTEGELLAKSLAALDWAALLEHYASRTRSPEAYALLLARQPLTSREAAHAELTLVGEALEQRYAGTPLPVRRVEPIAETLARLARAGTAGGLELRHLARSVEAAAALRDHARVRRAKAPGLAALLDADPRLEPLAASIARAIDDEGLLLDAASPGLAAARQELRGAERELAKQLAGLVARYGSVLSGEYSTQRDGRWVLPVRADAHLRVEGTVLGSSSSGNTLYVEPRELSASSHRLRTLEAAVAREEAAVLSALSARCHALLSALEAAHAMVLRADVLAAVAELSEQLDAHVILPSEDTTVRLLGMRHPLLALQRPDVVPSDLQLAPGQALIVSGPNAGGKTVVLKALGLLSCMQRAGLPLPVRAASTLGWFSSVLAVIGDEQSLARSLSTFSAHLSALAQVLRLCSSATLVLLDELAAGTDPEQGAALARAVLEALVGRGASVICTTHYERLKELAPLDPRFVNASVSFDFSSFEPKFRLALGVPGPSSALAVAERFGLPAAVVERARQLVPELAAERERVVLALRAQEQQLAEARAAVDAAAREQHQLIEQIRDAEAALERGLETELQREAKELTARVRAARARLAAAERGLAGGVHERAELRRLEREVSTAAAEIAWGSTLQQRTAERRGGDSAAPAQVSVGQRVLLLDLGTQGEVLELLPKGKLRVQTGALKLSVPLAKVRQVERQKAAAPPRASAPRRPTPRQESPLRHQGNTLDLRGERAQDVQAKLDDFVAQLLRQAEDHGWVLHGHGTGALKQAVREHLASSPWVAWSRAGERDEGGDAFTAFELRG